jgi:hypothetical protein
VVDDVDEAIELIKMTDLDREALRRDEQDSLRTKEEAERKAAGEPLMGI